MKLNQKALNYIQTVSAEMIKKANSGHTGVALGATTILYALFKDHYKFDIFGENINRDRLVLSAGHASALYYTLLYSFGFDYSIEDLENFRQVGSKTPGHPEVNFKLGIECSTGPLGQGVANAVGMAIASKRYAEIFNMQKFQIFDNKIYCFVGDGCLMEGVALEAISLAGSLNLNNLILLYDCNKITIDGELDIANRENVVKKFKAQGFNVVVCKKGNDYNSVTKAIEKAKHFSKQPTIIIFHTKIGYNSDLEGKNVIHGKPLNDSQLETLKKKLGITTSMFIPNGVLKYLRQSTKKNNEYFEEWKKKLVLYETTHPELFKMLQIYNSDVKLQKDKLYKLFSEPISQRNANHLILNELSNKIINLIGGTADVSASTLSYIENSKAISPQDFRGKNIHFGVREHAMGAICNGISLFSMSRCFCSTFLAFSNYMLPSIRMSALMKLPVWYFFTHDSIYIGEDGPTHQSIEQIGCLRMIPNLLVFRPCDCFELCDVYEIAMEQKKPCCFVLAKQTLPILSVKGKAGYGAYIAVEEKEPILTIMASGSEVEMAVEAKKILDKQGIRSQVVSVPCLNIFEKQSKIYKNSILKGIVVAVEASNDPSWFKYTQNVFHLSSFGVSGKGEEVAKHMDFTVNKLVRYCKTLVKNE